MAAKKSAPRVSAGGRGEVRRAISGRENELAAIAVFAVGVLIALAVYFRLAGPVGRGADTGLGAAIGLGRYLLPPVTGVIGWSLLRGDQAPSRMKLALGWGAISIAVLGLLHVFRGPDGYTGIDDLGGAGGWIGALFGQSLDDLIQPVGASIVMVLLALCGTLLVSELSLKGLLDVVVDALKALAGWLAPAYATRPTTSEP